MIFIVLPKHFIAITNSKKMKPKSLLGRILWTISHMEALLYPIHKQAEISIIVVMGLSILTK
jgi:hypothetical protein